MKIKNEGILDRALRFLLGELLLLLAFFWLGGVWQIAAYILGTIGIFTALSGFCLIYYFFGISTYHPDSKSPNKMLIAGLLVVFVLLAGLGSYYSDFFTRKKFLEDFGRINNDYKQTLFYTGQGKRAEAQDYYGKLNADFPEFQTRYSSYKPVAIRNDKKLNGDLQNVWTAIAGLKENIESGDLTAAHLQLEKIRPVFQDILKRNNFSPLSVALIDFHDSMETVLDYATKKDASGVLGSYTDADIKLKAVEAELNDDSVKQIRMNLDGLLKMAQEGSVQDMPAKGDELKSNFVKLYLKKG